MEMSEAVKGLCREFLIKADDVDEVVGHDNLLILYSDKSHYLGLRDKAQKLAILDQENVDEHKIVVRNNI
jgi:hypothetical protein